MTLSCLFIHIPAPLGATFGTKVEREVAKCCCGFTMFVHTHHCSTGDLLLCLFLQNMYSTNKMGKLLTAQTRWGSYYFSRGKAVITKGGGVNHFTWETTSGIRTQVSG